ncbi:MAG: carbon-nitrogen hydrolase family protein [Armatimonadota bacterium]
MIFKIAAYQMSVSADLEMNLSKIQSGVERAAAEGAKLIALPECAVSGYPPLSHKCIEDIDIARIAEINEEIRLLAAKNKIWVVVGTIVSDTKGLLNSALVVSSEGELIGRYDKMHLMPMDKKFFTPGDGVQLFHMDDIPFGVLICYDVRFPEPYRYLRERGARFIVTILNACGSDTWKLPVLEGAIRTRAAENSCFHIAVNAAGPLQMAASRICNPRGLDLAAADVDHEEMILAEIDLTETETGIFFDRRSDLFQMNGRNG